MHYSYYTFHPPSFRPKWRNLYVAKAMYLTDVSTSLDMTGASYIPLALHVLPFDYAQGGLYSK